MARKAYTRKTTPQLDDYAPKRGRPVGVRDEVTSTMLATGQATMAQIAQLFSTDAKTLPKRMRGCVPAGTRRGNKVYEIKEAAAYLVTPSYEIEEFIRQMSPQELPNLLHKEFWNGQNARLNYETKLGNYWPTEDIVNYVGELVNTMRMTLLLISDDIAREASITNLQREIFTRITDAAIATLRKNIEEKFREYHAHRTIAQQPLLQHVGDLDDDDWNIRADADDVEDDDESGEGDSLLDAEDDDEEDDRI